MPFKSTLARLQKRVDEYIQNYCDELQKNLTEPGVSELLRAMDYSVFSGGSRLRPALCLLTAETLGVDGEKVLPLATAIEFTHCYSLIHDDLPCMDDDDFRRGKPSNHKVFGDAMAVLAGDALATEAFSVLARGYSREPALALELVGDLAKAAGALGMAGGQAVDLVFRDRTLTTENLEFLHSRKTGALLRASVVSSAKVCGATPAQIEALDIYANRLGLVFQIADDISDGATHSEEPSFVRVVGLEKAKEYCANLIDQANRALEPFGSAAQNLKDMIRYIYERTATS